jgi:hypothetical protein
LFIDNAEPATQVASATPHGWSSIDTSDWLGSRRSASRLICQLRERPTGNATVPVVRVLNAGSDLEQRGLALQPAADDRHDLPAHDLQRDIREDRHPPVSARVALP